MKTIRIFLIILFLSSYFLRQAGTEEVLTWEDCLAEAKKNHPDLISAEEFISEKKAAKDIAASSLYPQVDADFNTSISMTKSTNTLTGITTKEAHDSYSYGVSGSQTLFDGFKTSNEVKAAAENINAASQAYRFTSSEVRFDLRSAFIDLLKVQELIKVAQDIVKIRRDNLELITLQYHSGLEHKGALLTAEANTAQAKFELSQAKRDLESAQRQLTKEMGRKEFTSVSVKGDFEVGDSVAKKPDFEELAENNPSLLQATAAKNAAAFNIRTAYADFIPRILGQINASKDDSRWPPRDRQMNLGLSVSMPLFEGGLRNAQVSQAQARYNQAEADERSIRDGIVVSLQQAWVSLQDAIEQVNVQRKTLEAVQERSKIAQAQYSTGFIGFDNWIIIENDLVNAKKSYLQAQANALLAEAKWIQAKGETLEYAQGKN